MNLISPKEAKENNIKFYFTGNPCRNGHVANRYTSDGGCESCRKGSQVRYYKESPEKRKAAVARYKDKNKERVKEISKIWHGKNIEKIKASHAIWRNNNREKERARGRKNKNLPEPTRACPEFCEICGKPETTKDKRSGDIRSLALDHCHDTGKFRGWLCGNCNQGVGKFKDSVTTMENAINYLKNEVQ